MKRLSIGLVIALAALLPTAPPTLAASCNGARHQLTLSDGTASPAVATTSTIVTFAVRYRDNANCAPKSMSLVIPGVGTMDMSTSQPTYAIGTVFSRALTLPAGIHAFSFAAVSGSGTGARTVELTTVSPAAVIVRPPLIQPTPTATPAPTPEATPSPAPSAPSPSTPFPSLPSATPTARPVAPPRPAPSTTQAPAAPATTPPAGIGPSPVAAPSASIAPPSGSAPASAQPSPILAPVPASQPATSHPGAEDPSTAAVPIVFATFEPTDGSVALMAAIAGALFTLILVGARRRHPPLATASAAVATPAVQSGGGPGVPSDDYHVTPLPAMRELIPPVDPDLLIGDDERAETPPEEADLPRWLRPSVRQARFTGDRDRRPDWR